MLQWRFGLLLLLDYCMFMIAEIKFARQMIRWPANSSQQSVRQKDKLIIVIAFTIN